MTTMLRRDFLKQSASTAVAVGTISALSSSSVHAAANDQLAIAVIGVGGMGRSHLRALTALKIARIVTLCDVDPKQSARAAETVKSAIGQTPQTVVDFRTVLDDKSVDAVIIATPHHWHTPIALHAMLAGKDVYVEKPASHSFEESQLLLKAARKYQRVFQHGTQMRSSALLHAAREVLDTGILGPITMSRAWNIQGKRDLAPVADSEAPAGVDYDRWLGPAPLRPFNIKRFHSTWRSFRDYGNGDFGDDGAHDLDLARWGLNANSLPVRITAHGNNMFETGFREYPDNMLVCFQYADGRVLSYEERVGFNYGQHGVDSSNVLYGTEGYMVFSRRGFFRCYLGRKEEPGPNSEKSGPLEDRVSTHVENFISCVHSREQTKADAEAAHHTCGLIHLGEIAFRTRTVLDFDPQTEKITNSEEAQSMMAKHYRKPYELPAI